MSIPRINLIHSSCRQRVLPGLAILCAVTGCWREVEYVAPETAANGDKPTAVADGHAGPSPPTSPVSADATMPEQDAKLAAGQFGEDLAATLSVDEPVGPADDPAATTPIADSAPPAREVGERYASKASDVTPPVTPVEPESAPPDDSAANMFFDEPVDPNEPPDSPVNDAMLPEEREAIAETSNVPIPNLDDDDIQMPPAVEEWNTRRAAWLLGSKLSLAALANEHGAPVDQVQKFFEQSITLAKKLNVSLKPLPARPASAAARPVANAALDYLFSEGQEIGSHLASGQGADHAALFEVAVKSNILLVVYKPGSPTGQAIASAIERAAERAKLPPKLWQPLVDALSAKATLVDVRKAVYALHEATDKYLDELPR